jgi:antitoxin component YwqK of YwqJK toxin-antitoxin module
MICRVIVVCFFLGFLANAISAQDTLPKFKKKRKSKLENLTLEKDTTTKLNFVINEKDIRFAEIEENKRKSKKEKKEKKSYFGIKTRAGMAKNVSSSSVTLEYFRVITPDYLIKNPYQREIYYYDIRSKKIKSDNYIDFTAKLKKDRQMYLLHGLYRKIRDKKIREEGYFYKGLKHSKWQEFDKDDILLEKIKYHLGTTEATIINYYDEEETKVKEIIPIVHGRKQGKYAMFYENGVLAMEGMYENNEKIGIWREWYENRQRKRNVQYPLQWWDKKEAFDLQVWDEKGKMTYDFDRGGKLKN